MALDLKGFKLRCTDRLDEGLNPPRRTSSSVPGASDVSDVRQRKPLRALQTLTPRRIGKTEVKLLYINFPTSMNLASYSVLNQRIRKAISEMSGLPCEPHPIQHVISENELYVSDPIEEEKKSPIKDKETNIIPDNEEENHKAEQIHVEKIITSNGPSTSSNNPPLFSIIPQDWYEQVTSIGVPSIIYWILIPVHLNILYLIAYYPANEISSLLTFHIKLGYFLFRSRFLLQIIFIIAVLLHFGEAIYAYSLCQKKGIRKPLTILLWTLQTFILGFPSLQKLKDVPEEKVPVLE